MNSHTKIKLTPLAASIAAAVYPSQPAVAQEEAEELILEEVYVTATLRETTLQVVPQSISAFTSVDIERHNLQNLEDVVRALPSLGLVNSQPGRNDLVYRGISSGSGEYYTDTQVGVYLDETSISLISQQPFPRMVDIERLESLPGPQGTLFGAASQTGTLRIITNKPNTDGVSGEIFGSLATTKGGDPSYEANGWVNIPLGDSFALRGVAYYVQEGGYIDNVLAHTFRGPTESGPDFATTNAAIVEDDYNEFELTGGRITALWNLSDELSVTLAVISESSTADGAWESDPSIGDFEVARFFDEYREDDWTNVGLTIQADLGFAAFTSNTSYFDRKIVYEWDNMYYEQYKDSYYGYYAYYGYGYPIYNSQYTFGRFLNDQNQDRFAQEFRLTSQSDSRLQWMAGLFYEDVHDDWYYGSINEQLMDTIAWDAAQYYAYYFNYYGNPVDYPVAPTNIGYSNRLDRDIEQTSVFGEISFDINDKWRLMGGGRWFEYDRYHFTQNQFPEGVPPWGSEDTDGIYISESKTSDTLWKFSAQYQFDENKMVYFLYSQGFRLGGSNSLRAANTGLVPLEYNPDYLDNYELGVKTQWLDNRLLLNATLFYMDWQEYQENSTVDVWWLRGTLNAADADVTGIEIQGTYLFTENLSMDYSFTFADPKWSENFVFPCDCNDPDVIEKGMPLPTSPKRKGFLAFDWNFPGAFGTDSMFLRYDISFQSKTWNNLTSIIDEDETGIMDSWNLSNLQLGAHLRNDWTVNLVVRNLFDQKATTVIWNGFVNDVSDWFETDFNKNKRVYNRPRTFGLQVRKRWN